MKVKYKLFKNKRGIISDRKPKKFDKDVTFCFDGAGENLTLILKNEEGETLYRSIIGGTSLIPIKFLNGNITVIVADLNNSMSVKYKCDGLICQKDAERVWIMPEEMDLPLEIIEAQNEIEKLKCELKKACDEIAFLKEAYQGYDVI